MSGTRAEQPASMPAASGDPRRLDLALTFLGVVCFVALRVSLWVDDFGNPDIGGMAYAADVIRDGGLVYVDTEEFKTPGAAYLVAFWWAVLGRSTLALALGWAVMIAVGLAAVRSITHSLYVRAGDGDKGGASVSLGVASFLYLAYAPMWEFNYAAWAMPIQAGGVALAVLATRRRDAADADAAHQGRAWALYVAAGALVCWAVLVKRQAVVAVPLVFAAPCLRARPKGGAPSPKGRIWPAWLALVMGAAVGFAPLLLRYAVAGHAGTLVRGLAGLGRGADYIGAATVGLGPRLLLDVAAQWARTFPVIGALACLSIASLIASRHASPRAPKPLGHDQRATAFAAAWCLACFVAAGLGGARFYLHYLVLQVPCLAVLAASPLLWDAVRRRWGAWGTSVGLAVVLGLGWHGVESFRGGLHRYDGWPRRLESGLTAPQAAGEFIAARTLEGDRIWVWGWTAWPVYFWADRRAHTRIYKPLGSVTTFNTNSAFGDTAPIHFRPGPLADELLADFDAHPPAFIAHSTSFVTTFGCPSDPLLEFEALADRIRSGYEPVAQFGDISVYQRRPPPAPRPHAGR